MGQNRQTDFLCKELEFDTLPEEAVDARLRRVYAELPDSLPTRRHMPVWVKRGLCTAASVLAACGLMLGINGANPALAESIPFVGSIFRAINDKGYMPTENAGYARESIAEYAVDVSGEEGSVVMVPAGGPLENPMTVTLKEVYYDGGFVFAGVEFQLNADYGDRVSEMRGDGFDILINGEGQIARDENGHTTHGWRQDNGFCDLSDYFWTNLGQGRYVMQRAFRVPDSLQDSDTLDIELAFDSLEANGKLGPINSTDFSLCFTARKTEVAAREIDCSGVEMNDVRLVSATSSPVATCLVVEYSDRYVNPACTDIFDDGLYVGGPGGATRIELGDGTIRYIQVGAGLREDETRSLVWRLFDKNGSHQVEAVFVLDFQNGAARVGNEADLKEPPRADYDCGIEAVKNLTEGYIVEKYHADQSKPMLYIASADSRRKELIVEVWQEGRLVESIDTHGYNGWWDTRNYVSYGADDLLYQVGELSEPLYEWMFILHNGYAGVDLRQPLTIKAYAESGELVLEEEIELEVRE